MQPMDRLSLQICKWAENKGPYPCWCPRQCVLASRNRWIELEACLAPQACLLITQPQSSRHLLLVYGFTCVISYSLPFMLVFIIVLTFLFYTISFFVLSMHIYDYFFLSIICSLLIIHIK